jgi:hypothetical protein
MMQSWILMLSRGHCSWQGAQEGLKPASAQLGRSVAFTSARQRLGKKRQALVHPVIDTAMIVGELLVPMPNAELVQPSHEPAGAIEQIELILLAAVDVERLQPTEIVRLGFNRDDRVLPQPIRPAFLDNLALFTLKPAERSVSDPAPSAEQPARKPRVLAILSPAPVRNEEVAAPIDPSPGPRARSRGRTTRASEPGWITG